jgi:hypothetical protein
MKGGKTKLVLINTRDGERERERESESRKYIDNLN